MDVIYGRSRCLQWLKTTEISIRKINRPAKTDYYRRITLCCVAYKVYAKFLLEQIFYYIKISVYHAGFQRNKSGDDHIFACEDSSGGKVEKKSSNLCLGIGSKISL